MKKQVRLTESDLHRIIQESVNQILIEEGWFDNMKAGAKAFMGKGYGDASNAEKRQGGGLNLKGRWNAAKTNYNAKDTYDKSNKLQDIIINAVKQAGCSFQDSIETLLGKLLGSKLGAAKQGSQAINQIYQ